MAATSWERSSLPRWGAPQSVGVSGSGRCCGVLIVGSQILVPLGERCPQRAVEHPRPRLQQQVRASRRPLHLLPFGEALADHEVDRGLDKRRGDPLAVAMPLSVVRDRAGIVGEVGAELGRGAREPLQARIVAGQVVEVIGQPLGPKQGLTDVAIPEIPFDPLELDLGFVRLLGVMVLQALGVLSEHGQAHGQMEPIKNMLGAR